MRNSHHGSFSDTGQSHDCVLQRDGADPLAAGLDDVFCAITDRDVAAPIDARDVARLEPPVVRKSLAGIGGVVVRRGDPRPAHLELGHAAVVPRSYAALVADAD